MSAEDREVGLCPGIAPRSMAPDIAEATSRSEFLDAAVDAVLLLLLLLVLKLELRVLRILPKTPSAARADCRGNGGVG